MDIFILDIGKTWAISLFRSLFAFLDYIIYSVIRILFKTMFQLANFELTGFYDEMLERVYVILGIFMLFKVTISLITYLVNPDKITDKEQGASKLVVRIITVLVMLILLPNVFTLLTDFQNKALPVIPKIIIGTSFESDADAIISADKVAGEMSIVMIQGFAHAKDGCGFSEFGSLEEFLSGINETCNQGGKKIYAYDYLPVFSTFVGLLMCYVIISLNIAVAVRAFKLIILKMIAPIPIVSYIDPKSSKDGTFSTWVKTFTSTWLELFMHVAIVYFIIFMIDYIFSTQAWNGFFTSAGIDVTSGGFGNNAEIVIFLSFIIIGLLFFARQAPKFLMDALGIKSKGNFTRMLGMGATAGGVIGSTVSDYKARKKYDLDQGNDPHTLRNLGASLFSGLASAEAGGHALLSTDKPTLTTGIDAQSKYNAQNLNRIAAHSTIAGRMGARVQMLFSGETSYDSKKRELNANKEANSSIGAWISGAKSKALDADEYGEKGIVVDVEDAYGNVHSRLNHKVLSKNIEGAQNGNTDAMQYLMDKGFVKTIDVEEKYYDTEKTKVGSKWMWTDDHSETYEVPIYEDTKVEKTRTVQKQVADWQAAFALLSKVEDAQVNEHMRRIAISDEADAENRQYTYIEADGSEHTTEATHGYDGANYDKYDRAVHAMQGLVAKDKDGKKLFDIKFDDKNKLLSTSKKMAGATTDNQRNIEQDPNYISAGDNAKEVKKQ